jgi:hypothetical protein
MKESLSDYIQYESDTPLSEEEKNELKIMMTNTLTTILETNKTYRKEFRHRWVKNKFTNGIQVTFFGVTNPEQMYDPLLIKLFDTISIEQYLIVRVIDVLVGLIDIKVQKIKIIDISTSDYEYSNQKSIE